MAQIRLTTQIAPSVLTFWRKSVDQFARMFVGATAQIRDAAVAAAAEGATYARFTLSTPRVDGFESTIDQAGWDLEDYRRNPVVLFGHNPDAPPIGVDVGCHRDSESGHLVGVTKFNDESIDPHGALIGRMVSAGILRGCSVGFEPIEQRTSDRVATGFMTPVDFIRQRLREYSVVSVPANADCLLNASHLDRHRIKRDDVERLIDSAILDPVTRDAAIKIRNAIPRGVVVKKEKRMDPEEIPAAPAAPKDNPVEVKKALRCPSCGEEGDDAHFAVKADDLTGDERKELAALRADKIQREAEELARQTLAGDDVTTAL